MKVKRMILLMTIMAMLPLSIQVKADPILVPLHVGYDDPSEFEGNPHKGSIEPPVVYIEDYTLAFAVNHPDYILYIKDEDGAVVYTTTVYSTQKQVILPSTLAGDYQIELAMGYWLFTGWINL